MKKEPTPAQLAELHKLPLGEQKSSWMSYIQTYAKDAPDDSPMPLHALAYGLRTLLAAPVFHYHHIMEILASIEILRLQATYAATIALRFDKSLKASTVRINGKHDLLTATEVEQLSRLLPEYMHDNINETVRRIYVTLITTLMQLEVFRSRTSPSITDSHLAKILDEYFLSGSASHNLHRFLLLPAYLFEEPGGSNHSIEGQEREQLEATYNACRKFLHASRKAEGSIQGEPSVPNRWNDQYMKLYLERLPANVLPVRNELGEFVSRVDVYVEHVEHLAGFLDAIGARAPDMGDRL